MPDETEIKESVPGTVFLGLEPYSEAEAENFFGRKEEIDKLTTLIRVNNLTLVFGKSGTGKTSLLNAGVSPKLRNDYCHLFRIKLNFNESTDLVSQIKKELKEKIKDHGFKVQTYPGSETLWEYFHKEPLWQMITPILVFDQFEEIFTKGNQNPRFAPTGTELTAFWEELSDIIENNIPVKLRERFLNHKDKNEYNYKSKNVKLVFSFREEYLPEFDTLASKMPSIKYSRFRLMPLKREMALEVITKTWGKAKINIEDRQAERIISSYLTTKNDFQNYVEPSLLNQVCHYIEKKRIEKVNRLLHENINLNIESQKLETEIEKQNDEKKILIAKKNIEKNNDKITGNQKLIEGGINDELLNENKEETTLSTIYNEAVNAAENALPETRMQKLLNQLFYKKATQKLKLKSTRIKVFLEDNFIDSKGSRIPYNLKEKEEEKLRPAISLLTGKYIILREDEKRKVIELTHDVIAPRILDDREVRRRDRRNRLLTILGILIIPALIVFAIFSNQASLAKKAETRARSNEKIIKDSISVKQKRVEELNFRVNKLDSEIFKKNENLKESNKPAFERITLLEAEKKILTESVKKLNKDIDSLSNIITSLQKNPDNPNPVIDSGEISRLTNEINRLRLDSINKAKRIYQLAVNLRNLDEENKRLTRSNNSLNTLNENLQNKVRDQYALISSLELRIDNLEKDTALNHRRIKELQKQLEAAKKLLEAYKSDDPPQPPCPDISKNSLRLTLHYTNETKYYPTIQPEKISIYLIPYNDVNMQVIKDNMKIIRKAKVYDYYDFNEPALEKAVGSMKARYCNGYYYFPNAPGDIKEGKYLIKVCTLYGAYQVINLKKGGNPDLYIDAVPPVR